MRKIRTFNSNGLKEISFDIAITDYNETYEIAGINYTEKDGEIEAGYKISLSGKFLEYRIDGDRKACRKLRITIKINSNPIRYDFDKGIFGGGVFETVRHLNMEINVEPWIVKDIIEELRKDSDRGIFVRGFLISDKVFKIAYFELSPPFKIPLTHLKENGKLI